MMKIRHLVLTICSLLLAMTAGAQELTVKKMEVAPMDLSASTQPRNDLNGNPCALVKVQLATPGASFEGNVIGDTEFKKGEYWVYMPAGNYMLQLKHPNFLPLFINFRDYDIKRVEGKTTYVLTLLMPQTTAVVKKQKLIVNYSPKDAIVTIDSESHWGDGHLELDLEVGSHDYQIVAKGYEAVAGSVKLTENAPRTITEHLVAKSAQPQQQQSQVVVQQPVQQQSVQTPQQPVDEFYGMTAREIADIANDYYYGRNGKTQDYAEAVKWWRKAADQGDAEAQLSLGICYKNGQGVTQDYAEAVKWYRKAADQGHAWAQNNLGVCYYNGQGVTKDLDKAKELWRKAAAKGNQFAKNNLKKYFNENQVATTTQPQQQQSQVVVQQPVQQQVQTQQQPADEFEGKNKTLLNVLSNKTAELIDKGAEIVYMSENATNPYILYLKDTHLYQFDAKSKDTNEVDLEKLNAKVRVLFGGSEAGIRSWKYDETDQTVTLKAQTYSTGGQTAGIGEYKLNLNDMTLEVINEGKVPQKEVRSRGLY